MVLRSNGNHSKVAVKMAMAEVSSIFLGFQSVHIVCVSLFSANISTR